MIGLGQKLGLGAGLAIVWAVYAVAQTEVATGPFTEAQIDEGRKIYATRCAACHLPSLVGQGEALPLAGSQFMAGWSNRTTQDLYTLIQSSMPKNAPGSLDDRDYANVTAFILHANGAKAGPTTFLVAPPLRIGLVANGIAPGDIGTAPAAP